MRVRRAHHHCVRLALHAEIVAETSLAGEEAQVLLAPQRTADRLVRVLAFGAVVHAGPSRSGRATASVDRRADGLDDLAVPGVLGADHRGEFFGAADERLQAADLFDL